MRDRPTLGEKEARELLLRSPMTYDLGFLRLMAQTPDGRPPALPREAWLDVPADMRRQPPTPVPGEGEWTPRHASWWPSVSGRRTTVGRWIANTLVFSRSQALREAIGYVNEPWTGDVVGGLERGVMDALLSGRIAGQDAAWTVDRLQWLGFAPASFLSPSMTLDTIRLPPGARKLKEGILAGERGDRIRAGDMGELARAEKEIIAAAEGEVGDRDPGFAMYRSRAKGSINLGGPYKNMAVMRGAMRASNDPAELSISTASLEDGIPSGEIPLYADQIVSASYNRSVATALGGYIAKQFNMAMQCLVLDPNPESDCRTPLTLVTTLDNPRAYLYRFYIDNGRLVEIMPDTAGELKGKTVKLRSPLYCGSKTGLCSRCAGKLHHRMGITNIGLVMSRIGTTLLNASLKSFHSAEIKRKRIDFGEYLQKLP